MGAHVAGILTPVSAVPIRSARGLRAEIIDDPDHLAPYLGGWDALAIAAGRPFCAPGWMLSWWRESRSGDARLRVVLVLDSSGELVGVGPFFARVRFGLAEYRLLSAGFSHRIGVLARPQLVQPIAAAVAQALAAAHPTPASVVFEGIDQRDPWPALLAACWPSRRKRLRTDLIMDATAIELDGDYGRWLARRERKFRKEVRRTARRLSEDGVHARIAVDDDAIFSLIRLNDARWHDRGGSNVDRQALGVIAAAADAVDRDPERIGVVLLVAPHGPIAAELVVRAGDTMAFWAGGFDPAWARRGPGTQALLFGLEAAAADGIVRVDLGGGTDEYKRRLADASQPLAWRTLFPGGLRYPLIRVRLAPKHLRYALRAKAKRLPPATQRRLRRVVRRLR